MAEVGGSSLEYLCINVSRVCLSQLLEDMFIMCSEVKQSFDASSVVSHKNQSTDAISLLPIILKKFV